MTTADNKITIVGTGMAGLLAGRMLSKYHPRIYEKQLGIPNNHTAVLRFRSSRVGDVLGIPFKQVQMIKAVLPWRNPVADMLAYSEKCVGKYLSDRSIVQSNYVTETRYIAPPDFISRMSAPLLIHFGLDFKFRDGDGLPMISTIPMPALMNALGYPEVKTEFKSTKLTNIRVRIDHCDAYATLLVPSPKYKFSRVSITGDELIAEIPFEKVSEADLYIIAAEAAELMGIVEDDFIGYPTASVQKYAKIAPVDEEIRRDFIYWATEKHNVYSLGRFATWRPKLLLDDLVQDVQKIEGWIKRNDRYAVALERQ